MVAKNLNRLHAAILQRYLNIPLYSRLYRSFKSLNCHLAFLVGQNLGNNEK